MVSDTYRRRRRLAVLISLVSVAFLAAGLYFGYLLETYSRPRLSPASGGLHLIHESRAAGVNEAQTGILSVDPQLAVRSKLKLFDDCRAVVEDGEETVVFFANRYSVLRGGQTVRGADLGLAWELRGAARGPEGEVWIFGAHEGKIVYRRRTGRLFSEDHVALEPGGEVGDLAAQPLPDGGLAIVWRVPGTGVFKSARWDGSRFVPHADVSRPGVEIGAAAVFGPRLLVVSMHREDREWLKVNLRLHCCATCGLPPPPERLSFRDPVLLLGRRVTGLAILPEGDTIAIGITRATTLQLARISASDFTPRTPKLVPITSEPMWRRTVVALWPILMMFFSFSLIFLGFTLMRERRKFFLEHLAAQAVPAKDGRMPAEILQRAMAHIIDFIALLPFFFVAVEVLSLAPETREVDWSDPLALGMLGLFAGLQFVYYFLQEWLFGRTLGKRLIGLRVCRVDGSRITFLQALLRNLLRVFDATFVLSIVGVAFMMITPLRQRLGDVAARTMVEDVSLPEEEGPATKLPASSGRRGSSSG